MTDAAEIFAEMNVRIDRLIWIPAAIGGGEVASDLIEAVNDLYDNNEQVVAALPHAKPLFTSDAEPDSELIVAYLAPVKGFLAQLARPIPTAFFRTGGHAYSWGYYQTQWVYVDDLSGLHEIAKTFSEDVVETARREMAA
jgi:hypothetical protein